MKEFAGPQPKENECFKCNKRITSVTAAECKFCKINYCRYHVLAEEHGCGIAASE
jgi:predicted nucleic acid binding AN1-type Zn finger protein